jgi:hypothetical protein
MIFLLLPDLSDLGLLGQTFWDLDTAENFQDGTDEPNQSKNGQTAVGEIRIQENQLIGDSVNDPDLTP